MELVRTQRCICGAFVTEYIDHEAHCWRTFHGGGEAILVVTLDEVLDSIERGDSNIEGKYFRWLAEVHAYEGIEIR